MPRDGSGVYSPPPGSNTVTAGTTILSALHNSLVNDLVSDANTARPITAGGTSATSASAARTALGLEIGADVQAYDADTAKVDVAQSWSALQTFQAGDNLTTTYTARYRNSAGSQVSEYGAYGIKVTGSAFTIDVANSLVLSGGPFRVPDGTVSAPSITPASDTNTGIYALAADSLGFTMGGTHVAHLNSTGWTVSNTSGSTTFGSVDAVKNLISGGGQVDITNTTGGAAMRLSRAAGTDGTVAQFHRNATLVGTISVTGSATAYNTSSDELLKDFIGQYDPIEAIRIIRADPVRDFTWKAGGAYAVGWGAQTSYGVSKDLATPGKGWIDPITGVPWAEGAARWIDPITEQPWVEGGVRWLHPDTGKELESGEALQEPVMDGDELALREVLPLAVNAMKITAVYDAWGVDQGKRTPYLWAALTWALDKIDELEARLNANGL